MRDKESENAQDAELRMHGPLSQHLTSNRQADPFNDRLE